MQSLGRKDVLSVARAIARLAAAGPIARFSSPARSPARTRVTLPLPQPPEYLSCWHPEWSNYLRIRLAALQAIGEIYQPRLDAEDARHLKEQINDISLEITMHERGVTPMNPSVYLYPVWIEVDKLGVL